MKLNNTVRMHRARLDLSQEELAKAAGVSRQAIHAIEREKAEPSVTLALKLARIFGLSVEQLFELAETDQS